MTNEEKNLKYSIQGYQKSQIYMNICFSLFLTIIVNIQTMGNKVSSGYESIKNSKKGQFIIFRMLLKGAMKKET